MMFVASGVFFLAQDGQWADVLRRLDEDEPAVRARPTRAYFHVLSGVIQK